MEPLLTAEQVAELLAVPKSWIYQEARAGRIPHITVGRYRRFARDSIEEWAMGLERGLGGGNRNGTVVRQKGETGVLGRV